MRSSSRPGVVPGDALPSLPERWSPGDLAHGGRRGVSHQGAADARLTAAREAAALANAERERELDAVRAEGYHAGRADGAQAESARLHTAIAAAESALAQVRESEARWQANVAENVAALAVAVARHVVGRELRTDTATVADLVRRALAEFPIDQPMRIRVHPHDLSLLSAPTATDGEPVPIAPNRDVRWMADSRITPGGCVVEGRERIIDGRVDTALERIYRRLSDTNA